MGEREGDMYGEGSMRRMRRSSPYFPRRRRHSLCRMAVAVSSPLRARGSAAMEDDVAEYGHGHADGCAPTDLGRRANVAGTGHHVATEQTPACSQRKLTSGDFHRQNLNAQDPAQHEAGADEMIWHNRPSGADEIDGSHLRLQIDQLNTHEQFAHWNRELRLVNRYEGEPPPKRPPSPFSFHQLQRGTFRGVRRR